MHDDDRSISRFIEAYFRALIELFARAGSPSGLASPAAHREKRKEKAEAEVAEDDIQRRYSNEHLDTDTLRARAARHGIKFAFSAKPAHQAAILDFLDNPDQPTPLTFMHMTWIHPIGQDGQTTASRTHPANSSIYKWHAHDLERRRGITPETESALRRLRQQYPMDRVGWDAAQWAAFETPARHEPSRPPAHIRSGGNSIPLHL